MGNSNWEYKGIYKNYDMEGTIELPNQSRVAVCDWTLGMPKFMLQADTLFIDPPWNIGNVNTFYTKADKPHYSKDHSPPSVRVGKFFKEIDKLGDQWFLDFSKKLIDRVNQIDPKHLFLEMGKQHLSWYIEELKKMYEHVTFYNSTYYHKRENKCYVIHATNTAKNRRYKVLEDMDEHDIIKWLCANHNYNCIGDLCMGRGLVGQYAYLNGKKFVGTELNPKRLAVLVDFITQKEKAKHGV